MNQTSYKSVLIWLTVFILVSVTDKVYKVERIGNCNEASKKNLTIDFSQLGKVNELNGFRITGAINVTRDIMGHLCMQLILQKCNQRGLQRTNFTQYTDDDFCPALVHNIVTGDLFSKFTVPPILCPVKKGVYATNSMLVNLSRFDPLPFDNNKWIFILKFYQMFRVSHVEEELGCWSLQMSRTTKSSKKRGRKN